MNVATRTETITDARYVAAKIATDLKRIQRLVGQGRPADDEIDKYALEMVLLLREGFLEEITYGFKQNEQWIMAVQYHATSSGVKDSDPGSIDVGRVGDAVFSSFLRYSEKWNNLSLAEKNDFEKKLPFRRGEGDEPGGNWNTYDNTYKSGDVAVRRRTLE